MKASQNSKLCLFNPQNGKWNTPTYTTTMRHSQRFNSKREYFRNPITGFVYLFNLCWVDFWVIKHFFRAIQILCRQYQTCAYQRIYGSSTQWVNGTFIALILIWRQAFDVKSPKCQLSCRNFRVSCVNCVLKPTIGYININY